MKTDQNNWEELGHTSVHFDPPQLQGKQSSIKYNILWLMWTEKRTKSITHHPVLQGLNCNPLHPESSSGRKNKTGWGTLCFG